MSLEFELYQKVKAYNGRVFPRCLVYALCDILETPNGGRYTHETATRKLRLLCEGDSAKIEPVFKGKKHIIGYRYKLTDESGQRSFA